MTATTDLTSPVQTPALSGTVELRAGDDWLAVCRADELLPGRGVAALLPDGRQVALFRDRAGRLYAIDNIDPFTGAGVLCHGLLGSAEGRTYVASPLLKQRFDLADGRCLDDDSVAVASHPVRMGPRQP
ncbi:nitrite reductase small subunit NirD [Streptomyces sp. NPDC049040]|uniref:nitrite reductase small subunit NirD n=1 Tax=Streptomyces sp. NPDC049040 TaxID=3365593 RepID=UPI0037138EB5